MSNEKDRCLRFNGCSARGAGCTKEYATEKNCHFIALDAAKKYVLDIILATLLRNGTCSSLCLAALKEKMVRGRKLTEKEFSRVEDEAVEIFMKGGRERKFSGIA